MQQTNHPANLRRLVAKPGIITVPSISNPLMARIAENAGFRMLSIGGFALGADTCMTEPLLPLTDLVNESRRIQAAVDVPVMVDGGAGHGEAIQVWQTVRELELAGVASIHIEDQVFPKRAHYHRNYTEHTIDQEHMVEKIFAAIEARKNPDLLLIARTDTARTQGYDEAVKRADAYLKAGADAIMMFPNSMEETIRAPKDIKAPLFYVVSHGNRVNRPVIKSAELADMGYKFVGYSMIAIIAAYRALETMFHTLHETDEAGIVNEEAVRVRKAIEDTIGLEHLYAIEERTTEKATSALRR